MATIEPVFEPTLVDHMAYMLFKEEYIDWYQFIVLSDEDIKKLYADRIKHIALSFTYCPNCDAKILEDQPGFCEACMETI